jgi:hypothetical protein
MAMDFQHSQPQSVYQPKNRAFLGLMVTIALFMIWTYGKGLASDPTPLRILPIGLWVVMLVQFAWMFVRTRLVLSSAGISIEFGRSAATPWSNVEGIQLIAVGRFVNRHTMPFLVLRQPVAGRRWSRIPGLPDELKGRVIPLDPAIWERFSDLHDEVTRHLPVNPADPNGLQVPINVAAFSKPRVSGWELAAFAACATIMALVVLYLTL